MAMEAEILSNSYGLPLEFTKSFIQFAKNDLEAAIRIIEASEKDMLVLKGKFISGKRMINGAFLFFYNFQTNMPEYIFSVVSSNAGLSRIKIEEDWQTVYADLARYMVSHDSDADLSSRIESQVLYNNNATSIGGFLANKESIDLVNLKRYLMSEISRVMMDTGIILKLRDQYIDIFRFKGFVVHTKFGLKVAAKNTLDWIVILNLKIEPVLAPIGGVDIEKVNLGDEILARIADAREIVPFVMAFIDPTANGSVYGRVVYIKKTTALENTMVILEFGAGIYGRFIIGGRVRLQVREKDSKLVKDPGSKETQITISAADPLLQTIPSVEQQLSQSSYAEDEEKPKKINVYLLIVVGAVALACIMAVLLWLFS